jgi:hypothetical protein
MIVDWMTKCAEEVFSLGLAAGIAAAGGILVLFATAREVARYIADGRADRRRFCVYSPKDVLRQIDKALSAIKPCCAFTIDNSEKDNSEKDEVDPVRLEFVAATSELLSAKAQLLVAYRRIKKIRD